MPWRTGLTEKLGITLPIVQAPMGGIARARLAASVCNAGGLGLLPIWALPLDFASGEIEQVQRQTSQPFGVNLNIAFGPGAHLDLALDHGVSLVHFFWGDAAPFVARARSKGAFTMATIGSAMEARRAAEAGIDLLIAQGIEAGGHIWGRIGLSALLPAAVDAAGSVPVIAAGGIADGRGLAAAMVLGAAGAVVGTALAVSEESGAHPNYKDALVRADAEDTVYCKVFDVGWPDAPLRVLRNSTVRRWEEAGSPPSGQRPGEGEVIGQAAEGFAIPRYGVMTPAEGTTGEIEAMSLYAGQGVGLVKRVEPARSIITRVADEALALAGARGFSTQARIARQP